MAVILNGWTEIASFLNRNPGTAQKWERKRYLPIHRAGSGRHPPVFAYRTELAHWLRTQNGHTGELSRPVAQRGKLDGDALARNRELRTELRSLMRATSGHVAELKDRRNALLRARSLPWWTPQVKQRSNLERPLRKPAGG
jgi:hypothetical protein